MQNSNLNQNSTRGPPRTFSNESRPGWRDQSDQPDADTARPQSGTSRSSQQFRGRARRGGRTGFKPPAQPGATPTVPVPVHKTAQGSTPKNDPLFLSALAPLPGAELRPNVGEHRIYSGAGGLNEIIRQLHARLVAKSPGFARRVCLSAFTYYVVTIVYAKMMRQVELNGFNIARNERDFVAMVGELKLKPPAVIRHICAGYGNVNLPNGRLCRFDMAPRVYQDDEESNTFGWFGQIGPDNHHLYRDYPNIAVAVDTIQRTIRRTANHNLPEFGDLPEGMQPEDGAHGNPNDNMIGYGPAQILRRDQLDLLYANGFNQDAEFVSLHDTIPYIPDLLRNVQEEIDQCKIILEDVPDTIDGSISQIPLVVELEDSRRATSLKVDLEVHSPLQINGANVIIESAIGYRVKYLVKRGALQRNKWCCYSFNDFQGVPAAYIATANQLRDLEPPILQVGDYRTVAYSHVARVREIHEAVTVEGRKDNPR